MILTQHQAHLPLHRPLVQYAIEKSFDQPAGQFGQCFAVTICRCHALTDMCGGRLEKGIGVFDQLVEDRAIQTFLAPEIISNCGDIYAGFLCQLTGRHAVKAALSK